MSKRAQIIPPDAYPQPVSRADAAAMTRMLRHQGMADLGEQAIQEQSGQLKIAVQSLVADLEKAPQEFEQVARIAHEIRGLAASAGLTATGRIAAGLYRYFDEIRQLGVRPDGAIVGLHISAIVRATNSQDEAVQLSDAVAKELAALVNHKLTEIKTLRAR